MPGVKLGRRIQPVAGGQMMGGLPTVHRRIVGRGAVRRNGAFGENGEYKG
jgi:hypothetical protein